MLQELRALILEEGALTLGIGVAIGLAMNTIASWLSDALASLTLFIIPTNARFPLPPWYYSAATALQIVLLVLLVFFGLKVLNRSRRDPHVQAESEEATKQCPFCFSFVPERATRCPDCTSMLSGAQEPR